jgi:hypothetical protein
MVVDMLLLHKELSEIVTSLPGIEPAARGYASQRQTRDWCCSTSCCKVQLCVGEVFKQAI